MKPSFEHDVDPNEACIVHGTKLIDGDAIYIHDSFRPQFPNTQCGPFPCANSFKLYGSPLFREIERNRQEKNRYATFLDKLKNFFFKTPEKQLMTTISILVTWLTFQFSIGWLKALAPKNIPLISFT